MYTVEDVSSMIDSLLDSVTNQVRDDLQLTVSMGVLAIKQLFEDADSQDVELEMDTSKIEDVALIEEVEKMRLDAPSSSKGKKTGKLVSLRDEHHRMVTEMERLKDLSMTLKDEVRALKRQYTDISRERADLAQENASLRSQLGKEQRRGGSESKSSGGGPSGGKLPSVGGGAGGSAHGRSHSTNPFDDFEGGESKSSGARSSGMRSSGASFGGVVGGKKAKGFDGASGSGATEFDIVGLQQLLDREKERNGELSAELEDAKDLLSAKGVDLDQYTSNVKNSKQFKQLKKLISQKNEQLLGLRSRLSIYEPDSTMVDNDESSVALHK